MAKSGYTISTEGEITLSTSAKTILAIQAGSEFGVDLTGFTVSFAGTTVTEEPVLCEICTCTFGGSGTSSSASVRQVFGRTAGTGFVGGRNYTAEPTTLEVRRLFNLTPAGGLITYDWPLGKSFDSPLGQGFALRVTAAAAVSVCAELEFERC